MSEEIPNFSAEQIAAISANLSAAAFENNLAAPGAIIAPDAAAASALEGAAALFGCEAFVLPDIRACSDDSPESFRDEISELINTLNAYEMAVCEQKTQACEGLKIAEKIAKKANLKISKKLQNRLDACAANGECTQMAQLIIPASTAALRIMPLASTIKISYADEICSSELAGPGELANRLLAAGYERAATVLEAGEFAINGDKIDIFGYGAATAVRVVFFDSCVESIREFDIASQLCTSEELLCVQFAPFFSELFSEDKRTLKEHFDALIMQPAQHSRDEKIFITQEFFDLNKDKTIYLLASNESKFAGLNLGENVSCISSAARLNFSAAGCLMLSLNTRAVRKKKAKIRLDLNSTQVGDYLVHEHYGVGKFAGLERIKSGQQEYECLRLLYAAGGVLLLPTQNIACLEPHAAGIAQLDTLGKASFAKTKEKIRQKLFAIAEQIAELAAKRALVQAPKIAPAADQFRFELSAGFELTSGQKEAISAIFADMQKGYLMDRLLAADVGFGKTEVAMHAAFATVRAGFNALLCAPTTLLSAQHFNSISARMKPFGIEVLRLDSSVKKPAFAKQLAALGEKGAVIVGTHSLLNAGIANIGLVIVDEEHKFGVKQKEKLKELSSCAHSLFMSATPIPRTLSAAISSLKSYSEIKTPPNERIGVQSFCELADDAIIKQAMLRELRRGGQIFYIHNRLNSLEQRAKQLERLLPNLRTRCLSSATPAKEKEQILSDFLAGEFDLLASTSIVESGLDMPRANTIIIERADMFGTADLHQLRGRVGRGARLGYCYFLHEESITPASSERLAALASNSYLGAGAALAQMDLQLRGGGNLLGEQQSGHIEAIGYGMYVRLLEEQLSALTHGGDVAAKSCDIKLAVSAFLDSEQIADDGLRLEFYQRSARAKNGAELGAIEDEFAERFGRAVGASARYFALMRLRLAAIRANISAISSYEENIKFTFCDEGAGAGAGAAGAGAGAGASAGAAGGAARTTTTSTPRTKVIKAPSASDEDVIYTALTYANSLISSAT